MMRLVIFVAGLCASALIGTLGMPRPDWLAACWELGALGLSLWLLMAQYQLRGWRRLGEHIDAELEQRRQCQARQMVSPESVIIAELQQPGDNRLN